MPIVSGHVPQATSAFLNRQFDRLAAVAMPGCAKGIARRIGRRLACALLCCQNNVKKAVFFSLVDKKWLPEQRRARDTISAHLPCSRLCIPSSASLLKRGRFVGSRYMLHEDWCVGD